MIDADVNLVDGTDYTVIASGLAEAIEPIVLQDDNSTPAAGNARVRAIHGVPGAPSVDIYISAPDADLETTIPLLVSVEFGDVADYIEAPAGDYGGVPSARALPQPAQADRGIRERWARHTGEGAAHCVRMT
ncbi:MAG TPA: DUF4397 domain-containing protein [Gemmatimonadales bacterium]|nr:DUF4397 domain-containing protein [Gemmatimonadales bacterium]